MARATLLVLLLCLVTLAQAQPLLTISGNHRLALGTYVLILEDPDGTLDVNHVRRMEQRDFQYIDGLHPNMGKSASAWWLRVDLRNPSAQPLRGYLQIDYPLLDDIRVYLDGPQNELQRYAAGDLLPFPQRPVEVRNFWFPLQLPPGDSRLLVRVRSSSTLFVPMYFATEHAAISAQERQTSLNGMFYGALLAMFFYNLFLFISLREAAYFWYLVYNLNVALFAASFDGLMFLVFPDAQALQQEGIYALMYLHCFTSIQFGRYFLRTRRQAPGLDRGLQWLMLVALAGVASSAFLDLRSWGILASLLVLGVSLVLLLSGAYMWHRGQRLGSYYILAWAALLIAFIQATSGSLGLQTLGMYGAVAVKIGVLVELLTLSIGLADRINLLKQEGYRSRRAAARANAENRAKSRFLAKMSHEIRTPLNGVLGMLQLLRGTELDHTQRFYVEACASSGDTLMAVINDILDYARIESGKLELENIAFDLERLLSEIVALFTAQALEKHLRLDLALGAGTPRCVQGDPTRLKQVLMNLLGNAMKFTEEGRVQLRVECHEDALGRPRLLFAVADTGIGIDTRTLRRLFTSFAQGDSSTTRRYGGSGLGLVISKQLVEMMGGQIEVQSTPRQGTRFAFDLPLQRASDEACADPLAQALHGRHALLGSADVGGMQALATLLERWGMHCDHATTPEQLHLALHERPEPSLVVLLWPWPGGLQHWLETLYGRLVDGQRLLLVCPPEEQRLLLVCPPEEQRLVPANDRWRVTHLVLPFGVLPLREALEPFFCPQPARHPQPIPTQAPEPVEGALILIVEDNRVNQLIVQRLLTQRGYSVRVADNGESAVQQYQNDPASFGLILMDCEMPRMDGFEATRRIRAYEALHALPAVPIIALTAHILAEHRERGIRSGMDAFLGKPLDSDALYATLARYLREGANGG